MWLPGSLHAHRSQSIYHHWSLSRSNNNSINSAENDRHHQQQCKRCKVINIRKNVGVDITGTVVTRQFWNAYFHSSAEQAGSCSATSLSLLPWMEPLSLTMSIGWRLVSLHFFSRASIGNISLLFCFAHQKGSLGHKTALKASQRSFKALKHTVYGGSGA